MKNNTIAVLPFINMSADAENEYFSDGITEEIINALARIESLKVISRTSSFYFKNKNMPLKEIAGQLGVAVILEGSIRVANGMVRITAQLIDTKEDLHFWSDSWDRKLDNIFEIQDEISLLIAEKLREQFGHFEIGEHLVNQQTDNLDAYQYSLKAKYHFNKWNPEDVKKSILLYEKAAALDPKYAESYVGLADAYGFLATTEFLPREEAWQKAADLTHKAFELDPQNPGVHYQLANLSFFTDCSFEDASLHTFKSIELKSSYPEAQQFMAFLYILSGNMKMANKHLQNALEIDPLNQETLFYKGYYLYRLGEFKNALDQFDDCIKVNPKNIPANIVRSYCLLKLGEYDDVLRLMDTLPDDVVIPDEQLGIRTLAYILKGEDDRAKLFLDQLKIKAQNHAAFQAHSYLFLAYANLGMNDKAFAWLEESLEKKSSILLLSFSDPLVNGLKKDPRYSAYHKKIYIDIEQLEPVSGRKSDLLDQSTAESYVKKIIDFMKSESPYLNPGLTLRSLAQSVEIHPNQLSWLLNEKIGKNFSEFINNYRVEHFKKIAKDPSNSHISLIGLAFESGFNSKTAFNTYFKKAAGITPSEFLKMD
ncbi:MAG: helix-turn-helix domain-containing protein [Melioribacteraceae bacterium]|nr:helix-turn-helix domain-containing protein [Melioribacteraceae bacterium]MCF8395213.1 helix-turn-helix domain-containing protein [Melioribacteraceae bacterium]MCF8420687.1 helix-turn-helix domain-containing protein [Melioribacteraceae bacterium]